MTSPREHPLAKDLHPCPEEEKRKYKKKRLVQSPNSYFVESAQLATTNRSKCQTLETSKNSFKFKAKVQCALLLTMRVHSHTVPDVSILCDSKSVGGHCQLRSTGKSPCL
ncbi:uncharacterized protein Rps27-ps7 [Rattus norvegicus]|uniref:LRRGT00168 n=1 Tax=Rattus norvegicus TaxID=10116 RepID=Q6QI40_RAT|nr:LRRGT00168 [Rattus norvegicus]